ncbi:MAG TPA: DUF4013 domain-containing protein [Syntrophomonadaceae bacterium]|nr:DUF4013 domain-containing protein [Syntrophomonadaceae bacterium]HQA08429.1 DUF4013 domain-containing protein [Syntrophomonadaceae bacterium]HQE24115.1 DUF4013 domain-containing protein [Syntrophomonadaceae bacterium]
MDLREYLLFPFRDPDWVRKLLLGCVVTLLPIVNILTLGYFLACLEAGLRGHQMLPEWDGWAELFNDGLQVLIICVVYLGIPLVLAVLLLSLPGIGSLLAAIIFLILGTMLPIAIGAFSLSRDLRDAFRMSEIFFYTNRIINEYISAYLTTALAICLGIVIYLLVPLLSILGALIIYYAGSVFFNLVGLLLKEQMSS